MLTGSCHCGALSWRFDGSPDSATACNCTICRRYGALWIYGWETEVVTMSGPSTTYARGDMIGYHFCPTCGCLGYYRTLNPDKEGRRMIAANLRMVANPDQVAGLRVRHFDGLDSFEALPADARGVAEMWF